MHFLSNRLCLRMNIYSLILGNEWGISTRSLPWQRHWGMLPLHGPLCVVNTSTDIICTWCQTGFDLVIGLYAKIKSLIILFSSLTYFTFRPTTLSVASKNPQIRDGDGFVQEPDGSVARGRVGLII